MNSMIGIRRVILELVLIEFPTRCTAYGKQNNEIRMKSVLTVRSVCKVGTDVKRLFVNDYERNIRYMLAGILLRL